MYPSICVACLLFCGAALTAGTDVVFAQSKPTEAKPEVKTAQTRDPRTGTWQLNVTKSTYKPGPAPKSQIVRIEPSGQGEHVRSEALNTNGTRVVTEYTAAFDGIDYPLTGSPVANTVSLKRIDARTTERVDKKDGQVMLVYKRVVSTDGKTMTVTVNGVNAQAQQVSNVVVFERVQAKSGTH
jgi:hypothetical protein